MKMSYESLLHEAVSKPGIISNCYRQFHNYSFSNRLAAAVQCDVLGLQYGPIATYAKWRELGRQVQRGAKALFLCRPGTYKKTVERDGQETEETGKYFKWEPRWFVLAQTEGEPLPEIEIPGFDFDRALSALGISAVPFEHSNGNVQGYASGRTIAINPLAALPHKTKFHELAHVALGHTGESVFVDSSDLARDVKEVEAESTAYILCALFDLPGKVEARGYIQSWLAGATIQEQTARRIFKAVDTILKSVTAESGAENEAA